MMQNGSFLLGMLKIVTFFIGTLPMVSDIAVAHVGDDDLLMHIPVGSKLTYRGKDPINIRPGDNAISFGHVWIEKTKERDAIYLFCHMEIEPEEVDRELLVPVTFIVTNRVTKDKVFGTIRIPCQKAIKPTLKGNIVCYDGLGRGDEVSITIGDIRKIFSISLRPAKKL